MSPRTEAGKALLEHELYDYDDARFDIVAHIDAIEAEARAQALEEVRAGVEGLDPAAFQKWWYGSVHSMLADDGDALRAAVLSLLDRLSKGTDG